MQEDSIMSHNPNWFLFPYMYILYIAFKSSTLILGIFPSDRYDILSTLVKYLQCLWSLLIWLAKCLSSKYEWYLWCLHDYIKLCFRQFSCPNILHLALKYMKCINVQTLKSNYCEITAAQGALFYSVFLFKYS